MRVLLVGLLLLAGCADPIAHAAGVVVLDYEIVDLGSEARSAAPGRHCGDAARTGQTLEIWLWPDEKRPDGPWLAVFPTLPPAWGPVYDGEPFKTTLPATVDPQVQGDDTILGELAWEGNATMRLDGEAVSLPHSWSVHGDGWRADATLAAWEGPLKVGRYTGLCD